MDIQQIGDGVAGRRRRTLQSRSMVGPTVARQSLGGISAEKLVWKNAFTCGAASGNRCWIRRLIGQPRRRRRCRTGYSVHRSRCHVQKSASDQED